MKKDFSFLSADGKSRIHAIEWIPEGEVKGALQICHGMVEYIGRYDEFARYLNSHGYYVAGHDHLGHGGSVQDKKDYGHFHETKGNQYVSADIHRLRRIIRKKYPEVPYYMLGHSMGSFLLRQYLTVHAEGLAGVIIMGTGHKDSLTLNVGQAICRLGAAFRGWRHRSLLVDALAFGGYNRRFRGGPTHREWISSDPEICRKYVKDPWCSFRFTLGAYYQMFEGMKVIAKKDSADHLPKDLPVFFVAGQDDPVGSFGKGVCKVYEKYKAAGIRKVDLKLYPGDRHEILNETDREQVYEDLYRWLEEITDSMKEP